MEFQISGPILDTDCLSYFSVQTWTTLNFVLDWCLKLVLRKMKVFSNRQTINKKSYLFQEVLQKYIGDILYIKFLKRAHVFYLFYG